MEEQEVKTETTTTAAQPAEKPAQTENKVNFSLSTKVLLVLFAFVAMFLLAVTKIVATFIMGNVFVGIMSIFIYLTALAGAAINFAKAPKPGAEFWISVGAFVIAIFVL